MTRCGRRWRSRNRSALMYVQYCKRNTGAAGEGTGNKIKLVFASRRETGRIGDFSLVRCLLSGTDGAYFRPIGIMGLAGSLYPVFVRRLTVKDLDRLIAK